MAFLLTATLLVLLISKCTLPVSTETNSDTEQCRPADIVFALPSAIGQDDTDRLIRFIVSFADLLGIDGKTLRLGFTPLLIPGINLNQGSVMEEIRKALEYRVLAANHSDIVAQLRHLNHVSFNPDQLDGRDQSLKLAVIFFDPRIEVSAKVIKEVNHLKHRNITVVVVSVGDDESTRLKNLVSCSECLLHAKNYAALNGGPLDSLETIVKKYRCHQCPPGFDYLPEVGSCYRVFFERMTWDGATERCRQVLPGVHLAAITSRNENDAIARYLQSQFKGGINNCTDTHASWLTGGNLIWIGGQTKNPTRCGDPYVWRPLRGIEIPFNYSNWIPNSPDCFRVGENCVQIGTGIDYKWHDYKCDWTSCAICELHV